MSEYFYPKLFLNETLLLRIFLPRFDVNTAHYTQIVWAESTMIGCGLTKYKESNGWNSVYLVCNYSPSGNFQGQPIYRTD